MRLKTTSISSAVALNTITEIAEHLRAGTLRRPQRALRTPADADTSTRLLAMIEWDILNLAIDELCAEFKAAQPVAKAA